MACHKRPEFVGRRGDVRVQPAGFVDLAAGRTDCVEHRWAVEAILPDDPEPLNSGVVIGAADVGDRSATGSCRPLRFGAPPRSRSPQASSHRLAGAIDRPSLVRRRSTTLWSRARRARPRSDDGLAWPSPTTRSMAGPAICTSAERARRRSSRFISSDIARTSRRTGGPSPAVGNSAGRLPSHCSKLRASDLVGGLI